MRCFPFSDTSRHKHRSIFLDIQQITKTERYLSACHQIESTLVLFRINI